MGLFVSGLFGAPLIGRYYIIMSHNAVSCVASRLFFSTVRLGLGFRPSGPRRRPKGRSSTYRKGLVK